MAKLLRRRPISHLLGESLPPSPRFVYPRIKGTRDHLTLGITTIADWLAEKL